MQRRSSLRVSDASSGAEYIPPAGQVEAVVGRQARNTDNVGHFELFNLLSPNRVSELGVVHEGRVTSERFRIFGKLGICVVLLVASVPIAIQVVCT